MNGIVVTTDGVRGLVKFTLDNDGTKQEIKFRWAVSEDDTTGFVSTIHPKYIAVTPVAAEVMLNSILSNITDALGLEPDKVKIFNHLGQETVNIEFMPPTIDGKEADIQRFVALQDSLKNLYLSYEESPSLNAGLIEECANQGVLDDFLSLVQFHLRKPVITLSKGDSNGQG
jgi:hypothetical protein